MTEPEAQAPPQPQDQAPQPGTQLSISRIGTQQIAQLDPGQQDTSTFGLLPRAAALAVQIANTEFVPKEMRGKPAVVAAAILTGHELGLPPMTSLAQIDVVDGRPGLRARAMRALVVSKGHQIWFEETTITRCVIVGVRADNGREMRVTWTMEDARKAGLLNNSKTPAWQKYPRAMLIARASSELCNTHFADVMAGVAGSVEELVDARSEEVVDMAGIEADAARTESEVLPSAGGGSAPVAAPARTRVRRPTAPAQPAPPTPAPPLPGEEDVELLGGQPTAQSAFDAAWRDAAPVIDATATEVIPVPGDEDAVAGTAAEAHRVAEEHRAAEQQAAEGLWQPTPLSPDKGQHPGSAPNAPATEPQVRNLAITCRDAPVDRHALAEWVSAARVKSTKELSVSEVQQCLDAARAIGRGEASLRRDVKTGQWAVKPSTAEELADRAVARMQELVGMGEGGKARVSYVLVSGGYEVQRREHPEVWLRSLRRDQLVHAVQRFTAALAAERQAQQPTTPEAPQA